MSAASIAASIAGSQAATAPQSCGWRKQCFSTPKPPMLTPMAMRLLADPPQPNSRSMKGMNSVRRKVSQRWLPSQ